MRNARTKVNRSVLATGILDFRADLTKVESDNIVRFQLSTENGKKEIETLHSVSLRNKVKVKKPADSGWRYAHKRPEIQGNNFYKHV